MGIRDTLAVRGRIARYEQATIVGIVLTILGSSIGWLVVEADAAAAAEHDGLEEGTTTFTGLDLGFGGITAVLALLVGALLAIVLWRYRGAGRKTGLAVLLAGLITFGVALVGIVLTGVLFAPAEKFEGVTVDLGGGIFLTLLGSLVMLSGGILRLAAGPPTVEPAVGTEGASDASASDRGDSSKPAAGADADGESARGDSESNAGDETESEDSAQDEAA